VEKPDGEISFRVDTGEESSFCGTLDISLDSCFGRRLQWRVGRGKKRPYPSSSTFVVVSGFETGVDFRRRGRKRRRNTPEIDGNE